MNRLNTNFFNAVIVCLLLLTVTTVSASHLISVETKPSDFARFTYVKILMKKDTIKITGKLKRVDANNLEEFGTVKLELLDERGNVLKTVKAENDNAQHRFKSTYQFSKRFSSKPFHATKIRLSHYFQP